MDGGGVFGVLLGVEWAWGWMQQFLLFMCNLMYVRGACSPPFSFLLAHLSVILYVSVLFFFVYICHVAKKEQKKKNTS